MIHLENFRDWVATQLQEKTCKKIAKLKEDYAKRMFSENSSKKSPRIYTSTNCENVGYKVHRKTSD